MKILNHDHKTIQLACYIAQKDELAWRVYRHVLPFMLTLQTKKLNSKRLMSEHLENLYETNFRVQTEVIGDNYVTSIYLTCIHPSFVEDPNYFNDIINLFYEVTHPNFLLSESIFNEEKLNLIDQWKTIKENKQAYAYQRFIQHQYLEKNYKYPTSGTLQDVKKMDFKELPRFVEMFNNSPKYYVFNGKFTNSLELALKDKFADSEILSVSANLKQKKKRNVDSFEEKIEMNQALLLLGYYLPILRGDRLSEAAVLFNLILGGYANSRLFQVIREEMGLCYMINSSYNNLLGSLTIFAGVNLKQKENAISAIKQLVDNLIENGISEEELLEAKENRIHSIKAIYDKQSFHTNREFTKLIFKNVLNLDELLASINGVTIDDIKEVAKKIEFELVYSLSGEENE